MAAVYADARLTAKYTGLQSLKMKSIVLLSNQPMPPLAFLIELITLPSQLFMDFILKAC